MNRFGASAALLLAGAAVCRASSPPSHWEYGGEFHRVIAGADRIVVRDGGFDCYGAVDDQPVLFEVTDLDEIREVRKRLQFEREQETTSCFCCGYPGIDWYEGDKRVALTSLQHRYRIRWKDFPGDARLTDESSHWLTYWLARHSVAGPRERLIAELGRAPCDGIACEARMVLSRFVPEGFADAVKKAEADAPEEEAIRDRRLRALFDDPDAMYRTLFRLMGCLAMRWNAWYEPEQGEAFELLTRAPRDELDRALRAAAESDDAVEKRGAARLIFSQFFMTL